MMRKTRSNRSFLELREEPGREVRLFCLGRVAFEFVSTLAEHPSPLCPSDSVRGSGSDQDKVWTHVDGCVDVEVDLTYVLFCAETTGEQLVAIDEDLHRRLCKYLNIATDDLEFEKEKHALEGGGRRDRTTTVRLHRQ